jgi:glycosyltransferase involved in cell wall biosynthesis
VCELGRGLGQLLELVFVHVDAVRADRLASQHAALRKAADDAPLIFAQAVILIGGVFGQVCVKADLLYLRLDKAVLEAMSCGCIVLTSNPAFRNILGDLSELLFVSHNDPACFAAAIKRIMALSPEERSIIGSSLRAIVVKHHSLERLTAQLVQELESLHGLYK